MLTHRPAAERGHFDFGWLDTHHTFSFGDYYDPKHMGFRALRVINDDRVAPGAGFPRHGHRDMEIITVVLSGAIEHADSMGHRYVVPAGDVQRMTAGTGVTHSEYNASKTEPLRFLQIWILPDRIGHAPGYQQASFRDGPKNQLRLIASPDGDGGSLTVHQDVRIYAVAFEPAAAPSRNGSGSDPDQPILHELAPGRHAWVQVARGAVTVNGLELSEGDGLAISEERAVTLSAREPAEVIVFDLA